LKNKILAFGIVAILLVSGGLLTVNAQKGGNDTGGANEIDMNGFHYTLNILGKKDNWNGGGGYNNPDRSTIFVPQDTDGFQYTAPDGDIITGSIAIYFAEGPEFAVIDGSAFDNEVAGIPDGTCRIELPDNQKFSVWICSRAKPGYTTDIDGMVYVQDIGGGWYSYCIGTLTVTRRWKDGHNLFYVTWQEDNLGPDGGVMADQAPEMWIFDYLDLLNADPDLQNAMYLWDFDNNGNKLVKVRFYPI